MRGRVHVYQDTAGGEALRAVRGYGVAVVKMAHLRAVEGDLAWLITVHLHAELGAFDFGDGAEVAVRHAEVTVNSGELNPVALSELTRRFTIRADALKTFGVVGHIQAVSPLHGERSLPDGVCVVLGRGRRMKPP